MADVEIRYVGNDRNFRRANDRVQGELRETGQATRTTAGGFGGLRNAVIAAGSAFVLLEAGRRAAEIAELGSEVRNAKRAFIALSGGERQAAENMAAMERASGAVLTNMQAQRAATRLLSLETVEGAEGLQQFTADAIVLGKALGVGPNKAVEDLSVAISNRLIARLDQLGISGQRVKQRADELTESIEGMTEQGAFAQAVMEQMSQKADRLRAEGVETGSGMQMLTTEFGNIAETGSSRVSPVLNAIAEGLAKNLKEIRETNAAANEQRATMGAVSNALREYARAHEDVDLVEFGNEIDRVNQHLEAGDYQAAILELREYGEAQDAIRRILMDLPPVLVDVTAGVTNFGFAAGAAATEEQELDQVTQDAITSLVNARGAVDDFNIGAENMVSVLGRVVPNADAANQALDRFASATDRVQAARAQLDPQAALEQAEFGIFAAQSRMSGAETLEEQQEARADLLEAQVDYQNALKRIQAEEEKAATTTASTTNSRVQSYDRLQSKMESVAKTASQNVRGAIEGALDLSGGSVTRAQMLMTEAGLYQDQPGEASRRLEDIMNRGFESPHVQAFGELAGIQDETLLKGRAAQIQQQFQAGLRPDLIDQEALRRQAEQQIIGQQNLRKVYQDVFADLKEQGVVSGEFQSLMSDEMRMGFDAGLGEVDFGGKLETSITGSIQNKSQQYIDSGALAADFVKQGILDNVDGIGEALADRVVELIFDELIAAED